MVVYTVNQRLAEYHGDRNRYEAIGETSVSAYTTWEAAEVECARLNAGSFFREGGTSILQLPDDYGCGDERVDEYVTGELEVRDAEPPEREIGEIDDDDWVGDAR